MKRYIPIVLLLLVALLMSSCATRRQLPSGNVSKEALSRQFGVKVDRSDNLQLYTYLAGWEYLIVTAEITGRGWIAPVWFSMLISRFIRKSYTGRLPGCFTTTAGKYTAATFAKVTSSFFASVRDVNEW